MSYQVIFSDLAAKQFKKLERELQERIRATIRRIIIRPDAFVSKLTRDPGYKLRIGDHRLILRIDWNEQRIYVVKIGHRKNIYDI
jgi:mRNA interferase RelE/StbE